jgi:excisionase family DNA binding protein
VTNLLNTGQAAVELGLSKSTLEHWRTVRKGPPFVRVGPRCIRYRRADLDAWLSEQLIEVN